MKIFLAIPSYSGKISLELFSILTSIEPPCADFFMLTGYTKRVPIHKARNELAWRAINHECTHIWFIDDDQIIERDDLKKLLSLDKDVVCSVIPDRNGEDRLCISDKDLNDITDIKEDIKIAYCGMGSTLIKTDIIKKIFDNKKMANPFDPDRVEINGIVWDFGEDIAFCHRVNQMGGEIWAKHDCNPIHLGDETRYKYEGKIVKK